MTQALINSDVSALAKISIPIFLLICLRGLLDGFPLWSETNLMDGLLSCVKGH